MNVTRKQYGELVGSLDEVIRAAERAKRHVEEIYRQNDGLLAPGDVVVNKPTFRGGNPCMPRWVPHRIKEVRRDEPWNDVARGIRHEGYYIFEEVGHEGEFWSSAWSDQVEAYDG